ncbi:MAG: hypothetical protein IMW89_10320 [Ktedonobacteraceae bacterium]|nr:hypothetical protein [Ktedonobacteraceae bacterium]
MVIRTPSTLPITDSLSITPLLVIQSQDAASHYRQGFHWSLLELEESEKQELTQDRAVIETLQSFARSCLFAHGKEAALRDHLASYLGMLHAAVLSPDGTLREDCHSLVEMREPACLRGYHAGRAHFFHEANPDEPRISEQEVLAWLHELVSCHPLPAGGDLWAYALGDLLGALSGPLFAETAAERAHWEEEMQQSGAIIGEVLTHLGGGHPA